MLAAGDTFRAAAIEQLQGVGRAHRRRLRRAAAPGADPGAVVFDALQSARARGSDVLLADTAGRLHSQSHLMEELKKVQARHPARRCRARRTRCCWCSMPTRARTRSRRREQFHAAVGRHRAWSSPSSTAPPRAASSSPSRSTLELPIRFIGVGETPEDFGEFDAEAFASALVQGPSPEAGQAGAA